MASAATNHNCNLEGNNLVCFYRHTHLYNNYHLHKPRCSLASGAQEMVVCDLCRELQACEKLVLNLASFLFIVFTAAQLMNNDDSL